MRLCQAHSQKTNDRFQSLRYSLHAEGGWLCMQHPGPRNGAAILEAFPSSGNIVAPFLGPVFGPIFGTTKEQTGAAHGASLPSATQAAICNGMWLWGIQPTKTGKTKRNHSGSQRWWTGWANHYNYDFSSKISKSTAVSWVVVHKVNVSYKWTTMISHWKWSRCRGTVAKVVLTQN